MSHLHMSQVLSREREALSGPGGRGAFRWDPRFKLVLTFAVAAANVGIARPTVSAALLAAGALVLAVSRPPRRTLGLFLLIPLWPTLMALGGFAVAYGSTPAAALGRLTVYREGLLLGGGLALRVWCDIVWLAALVLTTPFPSLLQALRWLRVPAILVDTLALMYRYAFLLHEEFVRMRVSSQSRGGWCRYGRSIRTLGRIAAQIFIRTFDRSERVAEAMLARGGE